jgi:GTP cyclohydrolase II
MPALHGTKVPYPEQNSLGGAMELFRAEMVAAIEQQSSKTCRRCNARLHLVRVMVDSDTGDVVHMFECQCGERIWIE